MKENMFYGASPLLFERARALRNRMTHAESLMWNYLSKNEWNLKFRRQHPVGIYIADFYCHKLKIVIEIDGGIHDKIDIKIKDEERELFLRNLGLKIIRFRNEEVTQRPEYVLTVLKKEIENQLG